MLPDPIQSMYFWGSDSLGLWLLYIIRQMALNSGLKPARWAFLCWFFALRHWFVSGYSCTDVSTKISVRNLVGHRQPGKSVLRFSWCCGWYTSCCLPSNRIVISTTICKQMRNRYSFFFWSQKREIIGCDKHFKQTDVVTNNNSSYIQLITELRLLYKLLARTETNDGKKTEIPIPCHYAGK